MFKTGLALLTVGVLTTLVAAPASADTPNFRVGIQLADKGGNAGFGIAQYTNFARFGNSNSRWAGDSNDKDPDAARIDLNVAASSLLGRVDFRIGGQASDDGGGQRGPIVFTPWASAGGGDTDPITDSNSFDPDQYRLFIETRPLPSGAEIIDFRLGIQAFDEGDIEGDRELTRWASQGGGSSSYAVDENRFDPDGFVITLEVI